MQQQQPNNIATQVRLTGHVHDRSPLTSAALSPNRLRRKKYTVSPNEVRGRNWLSWSPPLAATLIIMLFPTCMQLSSEDFQSPASPVAHLLQPQVTPAAVATAPSVAKLKSVDGLKNLLRTTAKATSVREAGYFG